MALSVVVAAAATGGAGIRCNSLDLGAGLMCHRSRWKGSAGAVGASKASHGWDCIVGNVTKSKVSRRAVAVGVSAGTAALIAGAVAAAGALAVASMGGRERPSQQAILVTRRGMQLFEQVPDLVLAEYSIPSPSPCPHEVEFRAFMSVIHQV